MSTEEDFKNAPVGATATHQSGLRAVKTFDPDGTPWYATDYSWFSDSDIGDYGYVLDHVSDGPKSAEEALDLAWELAYPVKEGQVIPAYERTIGMYEDGDFYLERVRSARTASVSETTFLRTFDPLPDPTPDWLDAPAVIALVDGWISCSSPQVFTRYDYEDAPSEWLYNGSERPYKWQELTDVTPLYPREEQS